MMRVYAQQVLSNVWFSLILLSDAMVAAVICLIPFIWRRFTPHTTFNIDYKNNETVLEEAMVSRLSDRSPLEKIFDTQILMAHVVTDGAFYFIMPCIFWILMIKFKAVISVFMVIAHTIVFVISMGIMYGFFDPSWSNDSVATIIVGIAPTLLATLQLKVFLPADCPLWKYTIFPTLISGIMASLMLAFEDIKSVIGSVTMLLVLVPIARVLCAGMARVLAKALTTNANIAGSKVQLRRQYGWLYLLYVNVLFAIWTRMIVAKLQSWDEYLLFLAGNTIQEVGVRFTIPKQDRFGSNVLRWIKGIHVRGRKTSAISPLSLPGDNVSKVSGIQLTMDPGKWQEVQNEWYSVVLAIEMVSEHIGLLVNLGLMLLFHDAILIIGLPVYGLEERPFDDPMPIANWVVFTMIQVLAEILVDSLCLAREEYIDGIPVKQFWANLSRKVKLTNLTLSTFAAIGSALIVLYLGTGGAISTRPCTSTNLCSCAPPSDNIFGRYCFRLYPDTNGIPPEN